MSPKDIRSDGSSKIHSLIMQNLDRNWLVEAVPKQINVRLAKSLSLFSFIVRLFDLVKIMTGNEWLISTVFA